MLYDRINDKFVTAGPTPRSGSKFSGEMPPGLLLAGVYTHCIKIADLRDDMAATRGSRAGDAQMSGKHYDYSYRGIKIDLYRIFTTYGIAHPRSSIRSRSCFAPASRSKTLRQDIDEAIVTLERWKAMLDEDGEEMANAPQGRSFAGGFYAGLSLRATSTVTPQRK